MAVQVEFTSTAGVKITAFDGLVPFQHEIALGWIDLGHGEFGFAGG
jgi:hypothetical protein